MDEQQIIDRLALALRPHLKASYVECCHDEAGYSDNGPILEFETAAARDVWKAVELVQAEQLQAEAAAQIVNYERWR